MSGTGVRHALLVLLALVVDDKLAPHLQLWGVQPDLVVPAVLLVTLRFGPSAGAWTGFAAGLFMDVATPEHLGARALSLAVGAFLIGRAAPQVDVRSALVQLVLIAVLGVVDSVIHLTASQLAAPGVLASQLFARRLPGVLYTALILAPYLVVSGHRLVPARPAWRERG